jgi:hypothetical protein
MSNDYRATEEFNCYTQLIKLRGAKISLDFLGPYYPILGDPYKVALNLLVGPKV